MTTVALRPVYLDFAATTPVDPAVVQAMTQCLGADGNFANAASATHAAGQAARVAVERARADVAALVGAPPASIVFTSGATESNNLAIRGVVAAAGHPVHLVTARTEHRAVLDVCRTLEGPQCRVTYLAPDRDGRIGADAVAAALRDNTALVSIMAVNNETGIVQDIEAIGGVCAARGVPFHVDAAQAAGKIAVDLAALPVDLASFSAHKVYGPKGVGALYLRDAMIGRITPQIVGGGQERGLRAGTVPTHQVVGMGTAFRLAAERLDEDNVHATALAQRLLAGLAGLGGTILNGARELTVPQIVNIAFEGVEGESLRLALDGLAVSGGSACSSASPEASYVLRALGRVDHLAQSSLRFSTGRTTTVADIDTAVLLVRREVVRLRQVSGWTPRDGGDAASDGGKLRDRSLGTAADSARGDFRDKTG